METQAASGTTTYPSIDRSINTAPRFSQLVMAGGCLGVLDNFCSRGCREKKTSHTWEEGSWMDPIRPRFRETMPGSGSDGRVVGTVHSRCSTQLLEARMTRPGRRWNDADVSTGDPSAVSPVLIHPSPQHGCSNSTRRRGPPMWLERIDSVLDKDWMRDPSTKSLEQGKIASIHYGKGVRNSLDRFFFFHTCPFPT